MALRKYSKHLPWALPTIDFLFDFVDMQWMFSHEPDLSEEVATRFQLPLLPGTLFFSPLPAILFNCGLAALVGTIGSLLVRLGVAPNSSGQAGRDKRRQGTVARVVACRLRCEEVSSPRWHRMWSTVAKKEKLREHTSFS